MTLPALFFGLLISTLYGVAFHLLRGGGLIRLLLDVILGWLGFWIGQYIAVHFGWSFISLGQLHLGMATLISLIFMSFGQWLGRRPQAA